MYARTIRSPVFFLLAVIKQGGGVYLCIKRRTLCDRDYRLNIKTYYNIRVTGAAAPP